jgi:hypothetical protein
MTPAAPTGSQYTVEPSGVPRRLRRVQKRQKSATVSPTTTTTTTAGFH